MFMSVLLLVLRSVAARRLAASSAPAGRSRVGGGRQRGCMSVLLLLWWAVVARRLAASSAPAGEGGQRGRVQRTAAAAPPRALHVPPAPPSSPPPQHCPHPPLRPSTWFIAPRCTAGAAAPAPPAARASGAVILVTVTGADVTSIGRPAVGQQRRVGLRRLRRAAGRGGVCAAAGGRSGEQHGGAGSAMDQGWRAGGRSGEQHAGAGSVMGQGWRAGGRFGEQHGGCRKRDGSGGAGAPRLTLCHVLLHQRRLLRSQHGIRLAGRQGHAHGQQVLVQVEHACRGGGGRRQQGIGSAQTASRSRICAPSDTHTHHPSPQVAHLCSA